jgi:hypothetical protein
MRHCLASPHARGRFGFSLCFLLGAAACNHRSEAPEATGPASTGGGAAAAAKGDAAPPAERRYGLASVFAVHSVTDYGAFKQYFDGGAGERAKAGVRGYLLSKLDDGRVVIHFFADELDTVKAALESPEMQKYVDAKGAPDASLVWLTRDVVVRLPATAPAAATYSLYLKVKVADFDAFRRAFEQRHALFAEHGVIAEGLHRGAEQDDLAIVHLMGTSRERLEVLLKRPEFAGLLALTKNPTEAKPLLAVDVARSRPD